MLRFASALAHIKWDLLKCDQLAHMKWDLLKRKILKILSLFGWVWTAVQTVPAVKWHKFSVLSPRAFATMQKGE